MMKQAIFAVATGHIIYSSSVALLIIFLGFKILSHFAVDEVYLTEISSAHFGEEDAKKVYLDFRQELGKVNSIMRERHVNLLHLSVFVCYKASCNFILC